MNEHPQVGLLPNDIPRLVAPPAPGPETNRGGWLREPPATPPTEAPAPAAAVPGPYQPPRRHRAAKRNTRGYATALAVGLAALGLWAWTQRGDDTPAAAAPTTDERLDALATQMSALAAGAGAPPATAPEVNPLSAMPCAVTNDARRFIGMDGDTGALFLGPSIGVAKQVYEQIRTGAQYDQLVIRTGVSVVQLEVAAAGPGVALFDCGMPAAGGGPVATTAPAAPATTAPLTPGE